MNNDLEQIFESVKFLSRTCGERVREMVQEVFEKNLKADQSFVTEVDIAIETLFRQYIKKTYPTHGIVGEELEDVNPEASIQWVIDPIDGTQNLVHGIPTYGIVIGVFKDGSNIAGAINHPVLFLEYYAAKGYGCFKNGQQIHIQDCSVLDEILDHQEVIALSTRSVFQRSNETNIFDTIVEKFPAHRVYYDIFSTTRAVEGQIAAVVEFNMKLWDIAATEILITEAGGAYQVVREVPVAGAKTMYSIIAGKPSAVKALCKEVGGFKRI